MSDVKMERVEWADKPHGLISAKHISHIIIVILYFDRFYMKQLIMFPQVKRNAYD